MFLFCRLKKGKSSLLFVSMSKLLYYVLLIVYVGLIVIIYNFVLKH